MELPGRQLCKIAGELDSDRVMRPILPFFLAMIVTLLLCTFLPEISMWLPEKLAMVK